MVECISIYIGDALGLRMQVSLDEKVIGFVILGSFSKNCADVHCLDVKRDEHRQDISKKKQSRIICPTFLQSSMLSYLRLKIIL